MKHLLTAMATIALCALADRAFGETYIDACPDLVNEISSGCDCETDIVQHDWTPNEAHGEYQVTRRLLPAGAWEMVATFDYDDSAYCSATLCEIFDAPSSVGQWEYAIVADDGAEDWCETRSEHSVYGNTCLVECRGQEPRCKSWETTQCYRRNRYQCAAVCDGYQPVTQACFDCCRDYTIDECNRQFNNCMNKPWCVECSGD